MATDWDFWEKFLTGRLPDDPDLIRLTQEDLRRILVHWVARHCQTCGKAIGLAREGEEGPILWASSFSSNELRHLLHITGRDRLHFR